MCSTSGGIPTRQQVCNFCQEDGREDSGADPHARTKQRRFGGGGALAEIQHHHHENEQHND